MIQFELHPTWPAQGLPVIASLDPQAEIEYVFEEHSSWVPTPGARYSARMFGVREPDAGAGTDLTMWKVLDIERLEAATLTLMMQRGLRIEHLLLQPACQARLAGISFERLRGMYLAADLGELVAAGSGADPGLVDAAAPVVLACLLSGREPSAEALSFQEGQDLAAVISETDWQTCQQLLAQLREENEAYLQAPQTQELAAARRQRERER